MDAAVASALHTFLPGRSARAVRRPEVSSRQIPSSAFPEFRVHPPYDPFPPASVLLRTAALGVLLPCLVPHLQAQTTTTTTTRRTTRTLRSNGDTQSAAEAEVARRQSLALSADDNLRQGDAAMDREDYEDAVRFYRTATDSLPDAPATGDKRKVAMKKFFNASIKLAELRINEARYPDAEAVAKVILRPEYDPNYEPAIDLLQHLEDPEYYNKTVGKKHIEKVQQVKQYLIEGGQFYDTGRFDLAFKRYEQVLALDPYNDAARRGEERSISPRPSTPRAPGYPATRGHLIAQTAKRRMGIAGAPQQPRRRPAQELPEDQRQLGHHRHHAQAPEHRHPNIEFRQTTLNDAVEFLRQERAGSTRNRPRSRARGQHLPEAGSSGPRTAVPTCRPTEPASRACRPARKPVACRPNDIGRAPAGCRAHRQHAHLPDPQPHPAACRARLRGQGGQPEDQGGALRGVHRAADRGNRRHDHAGNPRPAELHRDPPRRGRGQCAQPGCHLGDRRRCRRHTDNTGTGSTALTKRPDAKAFLESSGVTFPPGSSAVYLPSTSKLVVRNTQANIDLVQALVSESIVVPKQVEIESKFIEVTQNNLKELGFDWTLGAFNIDSGEKTFASGGTSATASPPSAHGTDNFPFNNGSAPWSAATPSRRATVPARTASRPTPSTRC